MNTPTKLPRCKSCFGGTQIPLHIPKDLRRRGIVARYACGTCGAHNNFTHAELEREKYYTAR